MQSMNVKIIKAKEYEPFLSDKLFEEPPSAVLANNLPIDHLYDSDLRPLEKVIFTQLFIRNSQEYLSTKEIASSLSISEESLLTAIKHLRNLRYIFTKRTNKDKYILYLQPHKKISEITEGGK